MKPSIKLAIFISLAVIGIGVFFFAPIDRIKQSIQKTIQSRAFVLKKAPAPMTNAPIELTPRSAPTATKSAVPVLTTPIPTQTLSFVDLLFKYVDKALALGIAYLSYSRIKKEVKKNPKRKPASTPRKEEDPPKRRNPLRVTSRPRK